MNFHPSDKPIAALGRKPKRQLRRALPYLGLVLLLALLGYGFWPQPLPVETALCQRGPLRASVNEEGKTRIKQRYSISAPVTGRLRRIVLKPGAEVRAGQTILAIIDPLPLGLIDMGSRKLSEARRDTARANLEKARLGHQFATNELVRVQRLFEEKTVSVQNLENAQWREGAAIKEEAAAESALREAEAELAEFAASGHDPGAAWRKPVEVRAPVTGLVLGVFQESDRIVTAGTPLLEIGDPADLEVVVEVLSRDGAIIEPGMKVELDQWGAPQPLWARVRLVEPAAFTKISALGVEEQRVKVVADLVSPLEQRRHLGDHFRVEAKIITWEAEAVLQAPAGALFRQGDQWAAFVVKNGRAELRFVKTGRSNGRETQIESGLTEGEPLILYPGDRIRPGQRVTRIKI